MTNNKKESKLTPREERFINKYIELGNATEAARLAGYGTENSTDRSLGVIGCKLLKKVSIKNEISKRQAEAHRKHIATAEEVMQYFTRVMNGEEKDQFGLDAPLGERTKAAQELAKRTVDILNREAGKADAKVTIEVDWKR